MGSLGYKNKGFTLIELLVVIAIISLLSSIVLSSLNSARAKAKDVAIISGVRELEKLLAMEYNDIGKYQGLQTGYWIPGSTPNVHTCDELFTSVTYTTQARNICKNIVSNLGNNTTQGFLASNGVDEQQKYSIMVALNNGKFFCAGSSGSGTYVNYWGNAVVGDTSNPVGCYYNP